jgi:hypothetical protein
MNAVIAGSGGTMGVIVLILLLGVLSGCAHTGGSSSSKVLAEPLSEPLNGASTATATIDAGDGNLTIDRLAGGDDLLASGTLEYVEKQGLPTHSVNTRDGQAWLTLRGGSGGQRWFRFPWSACNGATTWQVHLNPGVRFDITAHSSGGNVKLDLAGLTVAHVAADTGGGNMEVVLPEHAADLDVTARTGAGNVTVEIGSDTTGSSVVEAGSGAGNVEVRIPAGIAARIHARSGMGKAIVDARFAQVDKTTYQSPGYESAANKVDVTLDSGAGNVIVAAK